MSAAYDLHTHSTASDGAFSPRELVMRASKLGIKNLALTDHDTINGLAEAQAAAAESDLNLVNGIELSMRWANQTIHIVGLNIDPDSASIQTATAQLATMREERAIRIGERLARAGIDKAYENARRIAGSGTVTRQHFSQYLIEAGHAKNQTDVFKRFLVRNKPGYVSVEWPSLEATIDCIHQAGGIAVIAHPLRYKMTASKLRKLIIAFKENKGEAIEVVTGHNDSVEISRAAGLARQYGLSGSIGSDFHNESTAWSQLGKLVELPSTLNPVWQHWQH